MLFPANKALLAGELLILEITTMCSALMNGLFSSPKWVLSKCWGCWVFQSRLDSYKS